MAPRLMDRGVLLLVVDRVPVARPPRLQPARHSDLRRLDGYEWENDIDEVGDEWTDTIL